MSSARRSRLCRPICQNKVDVGLSIARIGSTRKGRRHAGLGNSPCPAVQDLCKQATDRRADRRAPDLTGKRVFAVWRPLVLRQLFRRQRTRDGSW